MDDWDHLLDQALHEPDPLKWRAALWELIWRNRPRAVEQLLDLVLNGPSPVRLRAADALGSIGDRAIAGRLLPALETDDPDLSLAALRALIALNDLVLSDVYVLGDYTSQRTFLDLLRSGNEAVLEAVGALLTRVGDAALIPEVLDMLRPLDLVEDYYGTDGPAATTIVDILAGIEGEGVVDLLISLLASPTGRVRKHVARALGQRQEPRAVEPLAALLEDEFSSVRVSAVEALGLIGDFRALEPLVAILRREERWERVEAAKALGRMRDACTLAPFPASRHAVDDAAEPLIDLLRDEKEYVRLLAIRALRVFGDARAVEPLTEALADQSDDVRFEVAWALDTIAERWPGTASERATDRLLGALRADVKKSVRVYVASALGKLGDERAIPALLAAVENDPFVGVRTSAVRALGTVRHEGVLRRLVALLHDEDPPIRWAAADALGATGDARAVPVLIAALSESDAFKVDAECAEALGALRDPRAFNALMRALKDAYSYSGTRAAAASALARVGDRRAIGPLELASRDCDEEVRRAARQALDEIRGRSGESKPPGATRHPATSGDER